MGGGVEEVCRMEWGLWGLPFFLLVSANYKMQFSKLIIIIISNLVFYAQSTITVIAGRNHHHHHHHHHHHNKQSFL